MAGAEGSLQVKSGRVGEVLNTRDLMQNISHFPSCGKLKKAKDLTLKEGLLGKEKKTKQEEGIRRERGKGEETGGWI